MGRRIFVDEDNKRYQFNSDSFAKLMNRKIMYKDNNATRITKTIIRDQLADLLFISPEAIRKWDANGGPADLDQVKKCATYFGVDYHDLLIPLNNQEGKTMNSKDIELVNQVFSLIISLIYSMTKEEQAQEEENVGKINREKYRNELLDINRIIHSSSLETTINVRNKLHRIIIETCDFLFDRTGFIPERWDNGIISWKAEDGKGYYCIMCELEVELGLLTSRKDALEYMPVTYLSHEISLAEKYGFDCVENLPDEYWYDDYPRENDVTISELSSYGFQPDSRFRFSPRDIYIDMLVDVFTAVFKYDFWGMHYDE